MISSTIHLRKREAENSDYLLINEEVLRELPGDCHTYYSTDKVLADETVLNLNGYPEYRRHNTGVTAEAGQYPLEFLNSLTPPEMPPYKLSLKLGSVVMLLRNISIQNGLCNVTRLEMVTMYQHSIEASLISGSLIGRCVLIPRIKLAPSDPNLPFTLERTQFPVRLSYVMAINKSQGQSFEKVGLFLPQPVFSHGQVYVADSRARKLSDVSIKVMETGRQGWKRGRTVIKNIVC
ncbi:ATP-dependent DNA helicase PIF1-like [Octopus sinensis]|uniref:ATP-dependent DNA helicase PIF1-like n=1 Tax=Octopus sinensis TaxID=2607531 RepID=A0A6P7SR52_9MOLL|nr:ATP-dependent DNA helicase PIF1-like [Octopus sinensis]